MNRFVSFVALGLLFCAATAVASPADISTASGYNWPACRAQIKACHLGDQFACWEVEHGSACNHNPSNHVTSRPAKPIDTI